MSRDKSGGSQTITFLLAVGSDRHVCRIATTFQTQKQALSYLHKHRREFERMARAKLSLGELDDGIILLTML